jgi:Rrf2 family cysteine metabolism transcriptional repressor
MISNKCVYALKAMLELSLRENDGPVPISEIAQAQNIPSRFLEGILRQLKQAGR